MLLRDFQAEIESYQQQKKYHDIYRLCSRFIADHPTEKYIVFYYFLSALYIKDIKAIDAAIAHYENHADILSCQADILKIILILLNTVRTRLDSAQLPKSDDRYKDILQKLNDAYGHITKLEPHNYKYFLDAAFIRRECNETQQCLALLWQALALKPDSKQVLNALNTSLYSSEEYEKAKFTGARLLSVYDEAGHIFKGKNLSHLELNPIIESKDFNIALQENGKVNVVSFSLWGRDAAYIKGIFANIEAMRHYLPHPETWQMRIYHDESVPSAAINALKEQQAQVILVDENVKKYHGGLWRFLVSDDKAVNLFLCRDADCRFSKQEKACLDEWLDMGKKPFHIMRDHIGHTYPILAGLWGGKAGILPKILDMLTIHNPKFHREADQEFLRDVVWPFIKPNSLLHDGVYHLFGARPLPLPHSEDSQKHIGEGFKDVGL